MIEDWYALPGDDELDEELLAELDECVLADIALEVTEADDSVNVPPAQAPLALTEPIWTPDEEDCEDLLGGTAVAWRAPVLAYGSTSKRVSACKMALIAAKVRKRHSGVGRFYGRVMVADVRRFQRAYKLPAHGRIDRATFLKLRPHFSAQARGLWNAGFALSRYERIASYGLRCYQARARIHYGIAHRMWNVRHKVRWQGAATPIMPWDDCSSFATDLLYTCGFPDPNGRGYDGYGYSGTMYTHGRKVTSGFRGGDCSLYGAQGVKHATVWISPRHMLSHGCEAGPLMYSIAAYRGDYAGTRRYI